METPTIEAYAQTNIPLEKGVFQLTVFRNSIDDKEHIALTYGDPSKESYVPARIHSECLTSEVFGSLKCDCNDQLNAALEHITERGHGVLLYMRQEGRGIGLGNKIRAYALQEQGYDTVEANLKLGFEDDKRDYRVAGAMLKYLGIDCVELMTNNPNKVRGLEELGIGIVRRVPIITQPNRHSRNYMLTKARKSGHFIRLTNELRDAA